MTRIPSVSLSLRSVCLAGAAFVALALPAAAQQAAGTLPPLVVTPTKSPVPLDEVGSSITVITREEIEAQNFQTLPDLLNAVPGLHVVQGGPQGALTSVFTRGSNSNQTLVLLNGRPIGDPSASNGAFNFAHLPLFNVEQVEVLRGPASALYGSKAIGGVINILTRQGEGEPKFGAQVEVGTQNTLNSVANANGRLAGIGYDLTLSRLATDGFSATADNLTPPGATVEADGYRNLAGSLALDAQLTETLTASFFGAILDTRADTTTPRRTRTGARSRGSTWPTRRWPAASSRASGGRRCPSATATTRATTRMRPTPSMSSGRPVPTSTTAAGAPRWNCRTTSSSTRRTR
jgi:vitamin B12 transporter